jgi:hypothetical protein
MLQQVHGSLAAFTLQQAGYYYTALGHFVAHAKAVGVLYCQYGFGYLYRSAQVKVYGSLRMYRTGLAAQVLVALHAFHPQGHFIAVAQQFGYALYGGIYYRLGSVSHVQRYLPQTTTAMQVLFAATKMKQLMDWYKCRKADNRYLTGFGQRVVAIQFKTGSRF